MSKEIKSNTFSKGLMMDFHPINTPNSVLTDNLNGTFITYDGNEHVLQNDMGNYKLKDCQLKSNYIPIGLKEHAGILYIVSYNPLDEHVEIGTYPSPEIKTPSTYNGVQKELWTYDQLSGDYLYSDIEKAQSVIWYDEKLKIHPGDYYKITTDAIDNLRVLKNAWFIMTDDKTLQEIEVKQNTNDYVPVTWEYPGYLVFQQKIVTPTEFNAFVSQLNLPQYIESEDSSLPEIRDGKIGFEFTMSRIDYNRLTKDKSLNDVITINVSVTKIDENGGKEQLDVVWNNGKEVYNVYDFGETEINIFGLLDLESQIHGLKKSDTLVFDILPVFKDENFSVLFDQYKITETISLNKIGTIDDLKIGSEVYKFWRQNNTCYVVFDIESPTIIVGDVNLYFRLTDLDGNSGEWIPYEDEVLSGENMLALKLTKEQWEQIYILEFCFGDEENPDPTTFDKPRFKKLLITSIVFNEFVGTHSVFDKEISFPDWYKLHDKYVNFNPNDFEINFSLENHSFTASTEKEIIKTTNERYWNTTFEDAQDFTYSLAIKEGDPIPKIDYTFGYVQENIPVTGSVQKLNESLLNYGIWKIPENEIAIKVGNKNVTCDSSGNFSTVTDGALAKNFVLDTIVNSSVAIPSVEKKYVNRGLDIEKTENGVTTVLKNQQIVGHQYGAGNAHSSQDRIQYNWAAENIVTSIVTLASKLSTIMSVIIKANRITAIGIVSGAAAVAIAGAILTLAMIPIVNFVFLAIAAIAAAIVAVIQFIAAISVWFNTERHLSWSSGLYSTNIETIDDIVEQFDELENGSIEPNEKFKNSLSLNLMSREQGTQWHCKSDYNLPLKDTIRSFLNNQPIKFTDNNNKTSSFVIKNGQNYTCFPVLCQRYLANNNFWSAGDGIKMTGNSEYSRGTNEFDTSYSVAVAFMSPSSQNNLVYVPCTFGDPIGLTKAGCISNSVDKDTGAPLGNGVISENDTNTVMDVSKMVAAAMVWCRNLFVISEEGDIITADFMEPVFPDIAYNASIVFEYECVFDYLKSNYLGKSLNNNRRVSLYNLDNKVENLSLMQGASVNLKTRIISDKTQVEIYDIVPEEILSKITERINIQLSKYKNFSDYCDDQITYSKLDPVITENTIRNGRIKGVYNTVDSYDASGGILNKLTQASNLDSTLTLPITDVPLRYYLCTRNKGEIGKANSQLWVTLGYDSKNIIDCSETFFDLSTQ